MKTMAGFRVFYPPAWCTRTRAHADPHACVPTPYPKRPENPVSESRCQITEGHGSSRRGPIEGNRDPGLWLVMKNPLGGCKWLICR